MTQSGPPTGNGDGQGRGGWQSLLLFFLAVAFCLGIMTFTFWLEALELSVGEPARKYVRNVAEEKVGAAARDEVASIARKAARGDAAAKAWALRKDAAQTFQAWAAAIAVAGGGVWALYVFVLGRSFSGTVEIGVEPKQTVTYGGEKAVVVRVSVRNTGRTKVNREEASAVVVPFADFQLENAFSRMSLLSSAADPAISNVPLPPAWERQDLDLFAGGFNSLEPGQDAVEEALLPFGPYSVAKVEVTFVGRTLPLVFYFARRRRFISRIILSAREPSENTSSPDGASRGTEQESAGSSGEAPGQSAATAAEGGRGNR